MPDDSVETLHVRIIWQLYDNKPYIKSFSVLKTTLELTDAYFSICITDYVNYKQQQSAYRLMRSTRETSFPKTSGDFYILFPVYHHKDLTAL